MKEVEMERGQIRGCSIVNFYKRFVLDYVKSREALTFGYPSGGGRELRNIDEMDFPIHIMGVGSAAVKEALDRLGLANKQRVGNGHHRGVKELRDYTAETVYRVQVEIWDDSEFGPSPEG